MLRMKMPKDYGERLAKVGLTGLRWPEVVKVHPDIAFEPPCHLAGGMNMSTPIKVGAFTLINGGRFSSVEIGRYCSIATGGAEHPIDRISTSTITYSPGFKDWDLFYDKERSPLFRSQGVG